MTEYEIDGMTLGVSQGNDGWFVLSLMIFLMKEDGSEYYAWVPFDMTSVAPVDKEDAMQYTSDMRHWRNVVAGCQVNAKSAYGE